MAKCDEDDWGSWQDSTDTSFDTIPYVRKRQKVLPPSLTTDEESLAVTNAALWAAIQQKDVAAFEIALVSGVNPADIHDRRLVHWDDHDRISEEEDDDGNIVASTVEPPCNALMLAIDVLAPAAIVQHLLNHDAFPKMLLHPSTNQPLTLLHLIARVLRSSLYGLTWPVTAIDDASKSLVFREYQTMLFYTAEHLLYSGAAVRSKSGTLFWEQAGWSRTALQKLETQCDHVRVALIDALEPVLPHLVPLVLSFCAGAIVFT